jgi:hypothetical protein
LTAAIRAASVTTSTSAIVSTIRSADEARIHHHRPPMP